MGNRAERRRAQEAYLEPVPGNIRPNVPAREIREFPCPGSKFGIHDFSRVHRDDPRGSGLTSVRCWHCAAMSPASRARADAWIAEHDDA